MEGYEAKQQVQKRKALESDVSLEVPGRWTDDQLSNFLMGK